MFSGGEVVSLLALIFTPVIGGYGVLFLYAKSQAENRIADLKASLDRQGTEHAATVARMVTEHERDEARLLKERDSAQELAWRSLAAASQSAKTTELAVQLTRATKDG